MAATHGVNVLIFNGATQITLQRNAELRLNGDVVDISTKDSADMWRERLASWKSGEMTLDGLIDVGDATQEALFTAFDAGTALTMKFGYDLTPTVYWSGDFLVTGITPKAGHEGAGELSVAGQSTGPITYTTP